MDLPKIAGFGPDENIAQENGPKNDAGARAREGNLLISPKLKQSALDALDAALNAKKRFWDKAKDCWIEEPDYAATIKAAELILAYGEGRPVERRLEIRTSAEGWEEQKERQLTSPEGIRFLLAAGAISRAQADEAAAKLGSAVEPSLNRARAQ